MSDKPTINIDQLRIGLYVHLDLAWFQHPFALSHFKIQSEEQIRTIRGLGLKSVRYDPAQSDRDAPPPSVAAAEPGAGQAAGPSRPDTGQPSPVISQALAAKRAMMERVRAQREAAAGIEQAFVNTAKTVREVEKNLLAQPQEAMRQATRLVGQIADSILSAPELAIHVMGDRMGGEELYFHSLNVATLSLMTARELGLPAELLSPLGLGALLHDIGRKEIPNRILMKLDPLTPAERNLYEMHCQYGADIGRRLGLPAPVLAIIHEHHEMADGSGYPQKLKGEAIGLLSRIVVLANHYDALCNPFDLATALTPHEALSQMFARSRGKFDPKLLQVFIRCLGVYPPGSIVQLSNGAIGMVATVNTKKPMKPMLIIYDESVPREEAILLDLDRESELGVAKAIRPAQLPGEIYNYLSPRKRVSYYFDAGQPGQPTVTP